MSSDEITVVTGVDVGCCGVPQSFVRVQPVQWRADQDAALGSVLGYCWARRGGRKLKGKVTFQSTSYSPAQLKQGVMTVITGAPAPLEPEDASVIETVREHISNMRELEAQETRRLTALASMMSAGRLKVNCWLSTRRSCAEPRLEFCVAHPFNHPFTEGDNITETLHRLEHNEISRESLLKASLEFRRPWLFRDPNAWWLNL